MKRSHIMFVVILIIIVIALVWGWLFNDAEARGYHNNVTNITNVTDVTNNYYSSGQSEALSACALGTAQAQIHPSIFSKHHQWGIGAGNCADSGSENAIAAGYHYVFERTGKHAHMIGGTFARSTEEVNAIGIGYNNHFD